MALIYKPVLNILTRNLLIATSRYLPLWLKRKMLISYFLFKTILRLTSIESLFLFQAWRVIVDHLEPHHHLAIKEL